MQGLAASAGTRVEVAATSAMATVTMKPPGLPGRIGRGVDRVVMILASGGSMVTSGSRARSSRGTIGGALRLGLGEHAGEEVGDAVVVDGDQARCCARRRQRLRTRAEQEAAAAVLDELGLDQLARGCAPWGKPGRTLRLGARLLSAGAILVGSEARNTPMTRLVRARQLADDGGGVGVILVAAGCDLARAAGSLLAGGCSSLRAPWAPRLARRDAQSTGAVPFARLGDQLAIAGACG